MSDIQDILFNRYYQKFSDSIDEYMFLMMTEDCHPLIDDLEKIICAMHGYSLQDYLDGSLEQEDYVRDETHQRAQKLMYAMLRSYADTN